MNNNTSLIWNIVLTLAVAVLFFLHFSNKPGADSGAVADGNVVPGRRTVYVQVDSLLKNYDYFKESKKELENKNFQLENDLNSKGKSLQNEVAFFQQKAQTMTPDQARSIEAQLMKKQQDLVAYRDQSAQALGMEEAKKNEQLYKNIRAYIEKYNKENYKVVSVTPLTSSNYHSDDTENKSFGYGYSFTSAIIIVFEKKE